MAGKANVKRLIIFCSDARLWSFCCMLILLQAGEMTHETTERFAFHTRGAACLCTGTAGFQRCAGCATSNC
jgi:hypothetical protein